jgi:hypothetical protein
MTLCGHLKMVLFAVMGFVVVLNGIGAAYYGRHVVVNGDLLGER